MSCAEVESNTIVGTDTEKILAAYRTAVSGKGKEVQTPELWDGQAAQRITQILLEKIK